MHLCFFFFFKSLEKLVVKYMYSPNMGTLTLKKDHQRLLHEGISKDIYLEKLMLLVSFELPRLALLGVCVVI